MEKKLWSTRLTYENQVCFCTSAMIPETEPKVIIFSNIQKNKNPGTNLQYFHMKRKNDSALLKETEI